MGSSLRKKALFLATACMPLSMALVNGDGMASENVVPFAYGDTDNWIVREIRKSGIIKGDTRWLYELEPPDTIVGNVMFRNMDGSPWATSSAVAKAAGVVKTNTSVFPEKRGDGVYARMETRYENMKVLGLVDIEMIATGSIFLDTVHRPTKGIKSPQAMLQSGVLFSKKSRALRFDYKIKAAPEENRVCSMGLSRKSTVTGQDSLAVILLLQKRWGDAKENVYSRRVGMMVQRCTKSAPDWVNDATYPILYGSITSKPEYKPYMRIQVEEHYVLNSKGESAPTQEVDWAESDEAPTHMMLQFTSSHGGAYVGSSGSTLWIDNVELIY